MHITKVELEDIKSHRKFSRDFNRGTTAITGANGAGKTTILEAIAWTLFDLLDYKKDDFLRRGAKRGQARVTFESHLDGRRYTVIRDTGTKYQVYDNELKTTIADKKGEVGRFLQQHLGVEPGTNLETLFRSAIGVPQGTLTADFLRTASERKPKFDKLLKVEEYREGAEKLIETKRFVENRLQTVKTKIAVAENELSKLEAIEVEHAEVKAKIGELETVLAGLLGEIAAKTQTVAEFDAAERLVRETQTRRDRAEFELDARKRESARAQTERDRAFEAQTRQKAIEPDYQAHLAALDELKILDAKQIERNRIQDDARQVENQLVELKSELKRLEENLQKAVDAARQAAELGLKIAEQENLEQTRENLRTARAVGKQAAETVENIEAQIQERLKTFHKTNTEIKEAARGAEAETKLRELAAQRREVESKLKDTVEAEASLKLLVPQRDKLGVETIRMREQLRRAESEATGFDEMLRRAEQVAALDRQENSLIAEIARVQAKIEHDEKFRGEVRNGLCPLLSAKCLNVREGETLETHFQHELATSYDRLGTLKTKQQAVTVNLASAREAEKRLAKLETVRSQIETARGDLIEREANLQTIEAKIKSFNGFKPETLAALRDERHRIEREIAEWNELAGRFAGMQASQKMLEEIKAEGKRLRDEQNRAKEIAARLPEIEREFVEIERKLKDLNNPRELAASLRREAEQETLWSGKIETTRNNLTERERAHDVFREKLTQFAALDRDLQTARQTRERTASAYQTFLANQSLAESLPARETELARAIAETERLTKELEQIAIESERAAQNYNHERHLTEKSALLDAQRREAETTANLNAAKHREAELAREIERLREVRRAMQTEFQEKYKLERVAETTDFIRDTLKKAAPEVAKSYLFSISKEANEIFREISGSAERSLRWTEDYEIMLEETGHERPFINLSGGEQMAAALSVRLALLKQLSDVRVAFFDEPTTNLDSERRERLAQQIGQIRNFDQLFVISHDDTFEENVDYHVRVDGKASDGAEE